MHYAKIAMKIVSIHNKNKKYNMNKIKKKRKTEEKEYLFTKSFMTDQIPNNFFFLHKSMYQQKRKVTVIAPSNIYIS